MKDAFHDHIIPGHRPKQPEVARSPGGGLPRKSPSKSPRLPPYYTVPEDDVADPMSETHVNGKDDKNVDKPNGHEHGTAEQIVPPEPRPVASGGARLFTNPNNVGTKAGAHYVFNGVPGKGGCVVVRLKMTPSSLDEDPSILDEEFFDDIIEDRRVDADEFYGRIVRGTISDDLRNIMRQALSGMLW